MRDSVVVLSSRMYKMLTEKVGRTNVECGFFWDGKKCSIKEDKTLTGNQMSVSGDMATIIMGATLLTLKK